MTGEVMSEETLPVITRRLHRILLESMIAMGAIPPSAALASDLGVGSDALWEHFESLKRADYLGFDQERRVTCLYPFSLAPTPHVVTLDGKQRFAMCSLDALGVAAMLDRSIEIESACPVCRTPIRLAVRPGAVERVEPAETIVVARRDAGSPAFEACCGFTVFACGAEHADALLARTSDTMALDLPAALAAGEAIFGGMLGDALPGKRTRAAIPFVEN